ncbi:uncharacterized protein LOC112006801 [Quercus suber]|uniref:uncharacterized protein LOC112006801 n=1 Tax=Quercus suber TaxID=58331 RepID=UPI000CE1F24A|nr:uncharacterized protein LOC112006801 [Quercus suber]
MSQAREPPILRQRNNHLPDDIVLNILARLPIKSVLRFRVFHNVSGNLIYLWNPSIRKLKKLPDTCLSKLENVIPGFAYPSDSNDYKVVRISCRLRKMGTPTKAEAEVYTLSSDSWQRVMLGPNVFISNIGYDLPTFGSVELPSMSVGLHFRHLAVFKGNLALIEFPFGNHLYLLVQVMREYGVWDQLFAVPLENGKDFLGFTRNGVPLFRTSIAIISFDPETSQVNDLGNRCGPVIAATLMESLVLLDKANIQSK